MSILSALMQGIFLGALWAGVPAAIVMTIFLRLGYSIGRNRGMLLGAALSLALAASPAIFALYYLFSAVASEQSLIPKYGDGYKTYIILGAGLSSLAGALLAFVATRRLPTAGSIKAAIDEDPQC